MVAVGRDSQADAPTRHREPDQLVPSVALQRWTAGLPRLPQRLLVPVVIGVAGSWIAGVGHQSDIGALGLIQALPWQWFLCVAALTVSFLLEVYDARRNNLVLAVHVVVLVVLLHGAPGFLESEPRLATAWLHAGLSDQILQHHTGRPAIDALFNWPGFFSAAAGLTGAAGLDTPLALARWAPVVTLTLCLPPLYLIGKQLVGSTVGVWLGLFLFVPVNWVGQDYFAPSALGFLLYLAAIALIVTFFRQGDQLRLGARFTRWRARLAFEGAPDARTDSPLRIALIGLLVATTAAVSVSHRLAPLVLVLATAALVAMGRFRLLPFPVVAGIIALGWVGIGATAYWTGYLSELFTPSGDVSGPTDAALAGSSGAHVLITQLRLWFTIGVWALTALSVLVLRERKRRLPVTLLTLAVVPLVALTQAHGGDGARQVFLFSAPFACLVIAQALASIDDLPLTRIGVLLGLLVVMPIFVLTRYGNEIFEQVPTGDAEAVRALHRIAPEGSNLISPTRQVPWRYADAAEYHYGLPSSPGLLVGDATAVRHLVPSDQADRPTYLIVTRGQIEYAERVLGAQHGWFHDLLQPLLTSERGYQLVFHNSTSWIYKFEEVTTSQPYQG